MDHHDVVALDESDQVSVDSGPVVRSDSLVEQRGFEPPVLFVVPGTYERLEVSARATALKPTRKLFSERSARKFGPKAAGPGPLF